MIRIPFCILTLFLLVSAQAQLPRYKNPLVDVQLYKFAVQLSDESDTIQCKTSIEMKVVRPTDYIELDLVGKKPDGKGMIVNSANVDGKEVSFKHEKEILRVALGKTLNKDQAVTVNLQYSGIPADGLIISTNKYKERTFFADNWPNRGHNWLACIDHTLDKAKVEWEVDAPDHYQVVANGDKIEEVSLENNRRLTIYRENEPIPPKVMVIGVARFATATLGVVDCIPVTSWVYAKDRAAVRIDYGQAPEILRYFIRNIGPYGYSKLANVQSKTTFGGLENAGTIFYFENSVNGKLDDEALVTHEIAHQWFGNMASESDWSHLWLSEGFATYMTHMYLEKKYGGDTIADRMAKERDEIIAFSKKSKMPVVDTSVTNYLLLLNANSYQKGGWVLHMLRRKLGDSTFWKGIRNYYKKYAGSHASSEDFQKVMEQSAGQDLSKFFKQWLYIAGQPLLDITWKYNAGKKTVDITITQLQETSFEFPLTIKVANTTKTISVKEKKTAVQIAASSKPGVINVDPAVNLLMDAKIKELD